MPPDRGFIGFPDDYETPRHQSVLGMWVARPTAVVIEKKTPRYSFKLYRSFTTATRF